MSSIMLRVWVGAPVMVGYSLLSTVFLYSWRIGILQESGPHSC